ncbi:hypothetical protein [Brevundimonas naejangsanensis]|uniref:hypothetical protein n=1 Tax=Brevundimonas naejangsanensis TaxID=588932 RepID=UPI00119CFE21|nr:hypothetical protein [Brevundimonas naejangsanensis]
MADDVRITNLPQSSAQERVAYDLYKDVMIAEGKQLGAAEGSGKRPDRKYLLDLYAECLKAAKDYR